MAAFETTMNGRISGDNRGKAEVIWPNGPWKGIEEVEFAVLEWVDWFNNRRLLEPIGDIPPAEFEAMYYEGQEGSAREAGLN